MEYNKEQVQQTTSIISQRLEHFQTDGSDIVFCLSTARVKKERLLELKRTLYSSGRPLLVTAIKLHEARLELLYYTRYLDDKVSSMKRALIDIEENTDYAYDLLNN